MTPWKKIALIAALLSKKDQNWLLKQLDNNERSIIVPIIKNLNKKNICSADRQLFKSVLVLLKESNVKQEEIEEHYDQAALDNIVNNLLELPSLFSAIIWQHKTWSWKKQLSESYNEQFMHLQTSTVSQAFKEAIVDLWCQFLEKGFV